MIWSSCDDVSLSECFSISPECFTCESQHTHTHTQIHTHTHTHIQVCAHTHKHTCIHIYSHTGIRIRIIVRTYTDTHTKTTTHRQLETRWTSHSHLSICFVERKLSVWVKHYMSLSENSLFEIQSPDESSSCCDHDIGYSAPELSNLLTQHAHAHK